MTRTFTLWLTVRAVRDGDTLYGPLDQGLGITNNGISPNGMGVRLWGCNARELEDPGGLEARDHLASLIHVGDEIAVVSRKWDKYAGRIDASVQLPGIGDLVTYLIEREWAAPYYGTGPKLVPPWPRTIP